MPKFDFNTPAIQVDDLCKHYRIQRMQVSELPDPKTEEDFSVSNWVLCTARAVVKFLCYLFTTVMALAAIVSAIRGKNIPHHIFLFYILWFNKRRCYPEFYCIASTVCFIYYAVDFNLRFVAEVIAYLVMGLIGYYERFELFVLCHISLAVILSNTL